LVEDQSVGKRRCSTISAFLLLSPSQPCLMHEQSLGAQTGGAEGKRRFGAREVTLLASQTQYSWSRNLGLFRK
jgi:hypothetical protein